VPTLGPAVDVAGQAPPVSLAVKLSQVRHGQRDTQLRDTQFVVVHLGPSVGVGSAQHATDATEAGHHAKVECEGESSRPGRCGEPTTQVLGLSKPQDGIYDRHSVGGHGQSNGTTAAGEM
jgi:hypothetical protein